MRAADDARRNPIAGDIVAKGRTLRHVTGYRFANGKDWIEFRSCNGSNWVPLTTWRRWARDAGVIHVAQAEGVERG